MKMLIKIVLVALFCVSSPIAYINLNNHGKQLAMELITTPIEDTNSDSNYENSIQITQERLQLNHEYIQYKIAFHENASIKFKLDMKYVLIDSEPVFYCIYLTDGEKILTNNTVMLMGSEPAGTLLDITIPKKQVMLGKLIYKTKKIGQNYYNEWNIEAKKNDSWYLTIGVTNRKCEEINIEFKTQNPCMELILFDRDNKIGYFSASKNDFDGFYFGVKILPVGISIARNLKKTITFEKGSVVQFCSVGHIKGKISIELPNGQIITNRESKAISYCYAGNQTGIWKFTASGIGFPFKHAVTLFYMDVASP